MHTFQNIYIRSSMFIYVCMCLFPKKIQKRKLTGSSAQNIFGDPRYSPGFPMGFSRFPRKKRINWIEVQTPPCLHTFRKVYVSIGSCQWCPPQSIHFQVQYPYQSYISSIWHSYMPHFEGLPPPSSHTFLAKSEGVNPPLCSYIIRNVGSTPPTPEPVGVGDVITC